MTEIVSKLQRWGNSFGVVIPKHVVAEKKLREGEEIEILIVRKPKVDLRKLFGSHKFSKPVEQLMKETDEELYDE